MSRSTLYVPGRDQRYVSAVFGYPGPLTVVEGIHAPVELTLMPGWRVMMLGAWLNVEKEPVGSDLICDIKYNDDLWNVARESRTYETVFLEEAPLVIADGNIQNEGVQTKFKLFPEPLILRNRFQPEGVPIKILFRGDILEVGDDEPGEGLTMTLEMLVQLDYPE